ncbi:MAG: T9SS type A sorting domain-containing protein [bacterium]
MATFRPYYGTHEVRVNWKGETVSERLQITKSADLRSMTISLPVVTTIDSYESNPAEYVLSSNYPNPFNPETTIEYQIPRATHVKLAIYNLLGDKVMALVDELKSAGSHSVTWNGENDMGVPVSSGIYFYKLRSNKITKVRKLTLLR